MVPGRSFIPGQHHASRVPLSGDRSREKESQTEKVFVLATSLWPFRDITSSKNCSVVYTGGCKIKISRWKLVVKKKQENGRSHISGKWADDADEKERKRWIERARGCVDRETQSKNIFLFDDTLVGKKEGKHLEETESCLVSNKSENCDIFWLAIITNQ